MSNKDTMNNKDIKAGYFQGRKIGASNGTDDYTGKAIKKPWTFPGNDQSGNPYGSVKSPSVHDRNVQGRKK